jgi:selenium-binding protein 1
MLGKWESMSPQYLGYILVAPYPGYTLPASSNGSTRQIENGLVPEELLQGRYGHQLHVWDLRRRRHVRALDLGKEYQMVLEMRPAHDPTKSYGFVGVVVSLKDLSASVWLWHRQSGE